jgi:ferredoxin-NADP reductase/predicted pyridoxine 5'-phosphate oxidase superfamily flavin-nucleotide-binding protein/ferredoxin
MTITIATPPGWDLEQSPFHAGELAIQERLGVSERIDRSGRRSVRRYMTDQHRAFFALLPHVFVGSVDPAGQPWASILVGDPGFVAAADEVTLRLRARPLYGDPLAGNLAEGAEVAVLGVELPTRRRNRVIGQVGPVTDDGFSVRVRQTMGVCPQYIQGRTLELFADPLALRPRPVTRLDRLDDAARDIIGRADTFFVASVNPRGEDGVAAGADISHRGGRPGFVRIDDERTLTTPDFVGNFIFNTLGNFAIDPRAGLLFVDFATGDTVQVAARAEVIWDGPEVKAFAGAQRLVRYVIDKVVRVEGALPGVFSAPDYSALLARTGSWDEAAATLAADRDRATWRPLRIEGIEDESAVIRSFYLAPADGGGLAAYEAGQFLPLRLPASAGLESRLRSYTLSDAPGGGTYRISVKREGKGGASDWLHDHARVGDTLEALGPRGGFVFKTAADRPAVLISAGVGITPTIAMLNSLLVNDGRTRHHAPIYVIHGARDGRELAFGAYLRAKASMHANLSVHISFSAATPDDASAGDHDSDGRVNMALLRQVLPFDDYDFYLCGPAGFMQDLHEGLTGLGVRENRIRFEAFGPASVRRGPPRDPVPAVAEVAASEEAIVVNFILSGKSALWRTSDGSLLDLAERVGAPAVAGCRVGACGACATRITAGAVDYADPPAHGPAAGEALLCVSAPHPGPHLTDGTLNRHGVSLDI